MGRRFTIAQLIAFVAVCGVAFGALRSPSYLWANALYTTAFAALLIAMINVVIGRGSSRAYWVGFLIAGGIYFVAYSVPALREPVCPHLLTEPILDLIYPYVSPSQPPPAARTTIALAWNSGQGGTGGSSGTTILAPPVAGKAGWDAWTEPDRATGVGYTIGSISLVSPESFRQVGHSLAILLFALFGGIYARHRFAVNSS
jgi:hypothetical protein